MKTHSTDIKAGDLVQLESRMRSYSYFLPLMEKEFTVIKQTKNGLFQIAEEDSRHTISVAKSSIRIKDKNHDSTTSNFGLDCSEG